MPAESFTTDKDEGAQVHEDPDLSAQLAPLLRARQYVDERDVDYLQELIGAAARRFKANRTSQTGGDGVGQRAMDAEGDRAGCR